MVETEDGVEEMVSETMARRAVWFDRILIGLILTSIISWILSTNDDINYGDGGWAGNIFDTIEWVSVILFTIEYIVRLWCAPMDPTLQDAELCGCKVWPRIAHIFSLFPLIDLVSIVPFYIGLISGNESPISTVLRVLRCLRLMKMDKLTPAFTILDDVFRSKRTILISSVFVAFVVIVWYGALYYLIEKNHDSVDNEFNNMPYAMFWTVIFLGGEWAHVDFTWLGEILSVTLALLGIGLFGIPVGVFSEAFQTVASEQEKLRREIHEEKKQQALRATTMCVSKGDEEKKDD